MRWFLNLLLAVLLSGSLADKKEEPVVTVKQGRLQGSVLRLVNGNTYYSFQGIPYAQPPIGDLRFRDPQPPIHWQGIRNATQHGSYCPQFESDTQRILTGSEDCLFLNVYTKSLTSKTPVMVYIHGGSFMSGSGDNDTYAPDFLFEHDVILVTINYRLEVLGFLCLDTPEVPGNAGIKDQVFALRWIKENIAMFGGDPDSITIFGESSGSGAVTYHLISSMSKGLFHKAIAQSGTCLENWAIARNPVERAFRVAKVLGKEPKNTQELLRFLRSVPATDLINMTNRTQTFDETRRGLHENFVPNVENKFRGVEPFMTQQPIDVLQSTKTGVPLVIGYNSGEGLLMLRDQLSMAEIFNNNSTYLVPRDLVPKISTEKLRDFGKRIMSFYTGDKGFGNDTFQGIVNMSTDQYFSYNTHRFVHFYSLKAPVYLYRFDYSTELSVLKNAIGLTDMPGACHADDLFYLFYNEFNKEAYTAQRRLRNIVYELTKLWTDFAKTSNPTPDGCTVKWKRFTSSGGEYLALDEVMTPSRYAEVDRVRFWNQLYCEANVPCIP